MKPPGSLPACGFPTRPGYTFKTAGVSFRGLLLAQSKLARDIPSSPVYSCRHVEADSPMGAFEIHIRLGSKRYERGWFQSENGRRMFMWHTCGGAQ